MSRLPFALLACLLACGTVAAQDHDPHDQGDHGQDQRDGQGNRGAQGDRGGQGSSGGWSQHQHVDHGTFRGNDGPHDFHEGDRLPSNYRGRDHYVTNYNQYHLSAPPRGHRWVRDDNGDFVLVAVTTGVIAQILSSQ